METTTRSLPDAHRALDLPALVRHTQGLLQAGVPLTLLLDLADDAGPRSHARYTAEGGDAGWLTQQRR